MKKMRKLKSVLAVICAVAMIAQVFTGFEMNVQADDTTDYTDVNLMQYATLSSTTVLQNSLSLLTDGNKTYVRADADSATLPAAGAGVTVAYDDTTKLAYYQADFDRELPLGRVTLCLSVHEVEQRARDIAVDVKLADGTWKRVAEKHNISDTGLPTQSLSTNGSIAAIIPMNFATVECMGFRVTANGQRTLDTKGAIGNFRLVEIEAYNEYPSAGTPTGTTEDSNSAYNIPHIEPDYTDVNLMQYATLSSTTVVYGELEKLRDGDKTYYRADADSATLPAAGQGVVVAYDDTTKLAYYQADFDRELPLGRVTLCLSVHEVEQRARDIAVDVKLADGTWQRVAEKHNISDTGLPTQSLSTNGSIAAIIPMNFATVECMGFRVTANGQRTLDTKGAIGNFRLVEIEAYNEYPSAGTPTGTTEDSNSAYNIPHIEPDYTDVNLMQYATLSSTTVVYGELEKLRDGDKTYYRADADSATLPAAGQGVVVAYDDTTKLAYYQADFERELPLGRVTLCLSVHEVEQRARDIAVDVKLADGTWQRVAEKHNISDTGVPTQSLSTNGSIAAIIPMNFATVECMGFRVTANGQRTLDTKGAIGNFRLVEIEAYNEYPSAGTPTGTTEDSTSTYNIPHIEPDYTGINLMKYATLSSTTVLTEVGLTCLTDGNKTYERKGTDTSVPTVQTGVAVAYDDTSKLAYYQADFNTTLPLGRVTLYLYIGETNQRPMDFAVDVQLTNGTWERVAERHNFTGASTEPVGTDGSYAAYIAMNFTTVDCVAFRVTANGQRTETENGNIGNFRLVEIEAYNEYPSAGTPTGTTEDSNGAYNIPLLDLFNGMTIQPLITDSVAMKYAWTSLKECVSGDMSVTFTMNGETVAGVISEDGLSVTFAGVRAQNMADTITATFQIGNDTKVYEYSVAQYCRTMLDDETSSDELKHFLVDLVQYGAQVQTFRKETDTLTSILTTADLAYDTDTSDETALASLSYVESKVKTDDGITVQDTDPTWKSVTLVLKDKLNFRCKFNVTEIEGMSVKVYLADNTEATWEFDSSAFVSAGSGVYYLDFDNIDTNQYGTTFKFRFYNSDGEQVGRTLNYSVNTYLYAMRENTTVYSLLTAINALGKSAAAYQ